MEILAESVRATLYCTDDVANYNSDHHKYRTLHVLIIYNKLVLVQYSNKILISIVLVQYSNNINKYSISTVQ